MDITPTPEFQKAVLYEHAIWRIWKRTSSPECEHIARRLSDEIGAIEGIDDYQRTDINDLLSDFYLAAFKSGFEAAAEEKAAAE